MSKEEGSELYDPFSDIPDQLTPSKPPTTLREMWAELHWWSYKNFPNETLMDTLDHIEKELAEAREAQQARLNQDRAMNDAWNDLDRALVKELADIMILAGKMMGNMGADPETEILGKWEEVRERTYIDGERQPQDKRLSD